jgi:hypothetical protein
MELEVSSTRPRISITWTVIAIVGAILTAAVFRAEPPVQPNYVGIASTR